MSTSVARPKLAVIVANGIDGDSRVQKTALAAARAGWDVTLIGRSSSKHTQRSWFGPVKVVRVPVASHMKRRVAARAGQGGARAHLTQFGIKDRAGLEQLRAAHGAWVREKTARIGWLSESSAGAPAAVGLKAVVRARRGAHKLRLKAYKWEQGRKPEEKPTGDWRKDWPALLDLDLAFGPVIEKLAPDVIHANDITAINLGAMAAARLRASGRKCVWLYDAHEYVAGVEWPQPRMNTAFPAVEKEFITKADAVVTVSPEIAEVIRKDYGLAKTPLVVRNTPIRETIGGAAGRVSVRQACGLDDGVPLLVYSGWISSERGLGTAVEGLAQLPGYHLAVVAGKRSPELVRLLALAEETGVRDRIHVVPYVAQHEVADYLSTADLGLICSQRTINYELSLPTKTAEYLHAGLPIIASDVKTLSAFVREHGVGEVFVSGEAGSFVEAVTRGFARVADMKAQITESILTELSWEHQCEGLMALYSEISGLTPPAAAAGFSWGPSSARSPTRTTRRSRARSWSGAGPRSARRRSSSASARPTTPGSSPRSRRPSPVNGPMSRRRWSSTVRRRRMSTRPTSTWRARPSRTSMSSSNRCSGWCRATRTSSPTPSAPSSAGSTATASRATCPRSATAG